MSDGVGWWVKRLLTILVVCCCIATTVGCIFLMDDIFKEETGYTTSEKMAAVVTYGFYLLFALILFLVEWEPLWMFNYALFLHYWPGRGMMQVYLGMQLLYSAATMNEVDVFGLEGKNVKTAVKVFGWCFFGSGCFYVLLGMMCVRRDNKAVNRLRSGGGRKEDVEQGSRTPVANLALLRKMQAEGVDHLDPAITALENLEAEEASNRVSGWFRSKFGRKKTEKEKKPGPTSTTASRPQELGVSTEPSSHAAYLQQPQQHQQSVSFEQPQPSKPVPAHESESRCDVDDDIRRRREEEDAKIEAEYMRRQYPL